MAFIARAGLRSRVLAHLRPARFYSVENKAGVVVGVYDSDGKETLSDGAQQVNTESSGNLSRLLQYGGAVKKGKSRVLYGVSETFPVVAVVGLGPAEKAEEVLEERDEAKEAVRAAVAAGCRSLEEAGMSRIQVDPCGDAEAAAEGAHLVTFKYQELKAKKKPVPTIECLVKDNESWIRGAVLAEGQNVARRLMETPANILTPTNFAQEAVNSLEGLGVEVLVRGYEWAKERNMNAFLSVTRGSVEPPVFLELTYRGADYTEKPLAIVGKGVTFDTGGISLKPSANMDKMRADMGGAACTIGSLLVAASLRLPINIKGFIPLCENMPGGSATKPGDVVVASNGKSIQIDNTDAEGRLILADALHYASQHKPRAMIDMATLTGAMAVALGAGATGVFSNSSILWQLMHRAGATSGDRVWRMPLWKHYSSQVTDCHLADINNQAKDKPAGGSCSAAAFLKEFVTCDHWMHLDIAGVMENKDEVPYLGKGMSGRPTRTVAHFAELLAQGEGGI
ncbi:cytosol aminopeptidase-like isoform X3 [Penaeus chinensis]|uniref:cytosol aminopeptidase-like isoform X3 n=1 Tax=Penaeus chinensis TaxID=139456 RepID=UPI001FB83505|nr:cytosol aminopeptidase-like isoform X3 [Penaeus chinensis]